MVGFLDLGAASLTPARACEPLRGAGSDGKKDFHNVKDFCYRAKHNLHREGCMSFREKSAWISALSVLLCFGFYFGVTFTRRMSGPENGYLLLGCVAAFVVLQIGLNLAAMWTTPRDGRTPRDERERMIQARSHTIGYYLLLVLILTLGIALHLFHARAHQLMGLAALDLVIAGFVVAVAQIVMFRRGF
jgi:hypothetical protein